MSHRPDPNKPWYSYKGGSYDSGAPYFFTSADFPWAKALEENFAVIKKEIEAYMHAMGSSMNPYFNHDLVKKKASWKVGEFYFWSQRYPEACKYVPTLEKILLSIPGFMSAGVSVLEPHTKIEPHYGDTNVTIRAHLGLQIPMGLPQCGIGVGKDERGWEEGKILLFCDANRHYAWNESDKVRYVLILDVLRPEFMHDKKNICANVLSLIALQRAEYKIPFLRRLPGPVRGFIRHYFKFKVGKKIA